MFGLELITNIDLYFLIFARVIVLIFTAPLLNSEAVPPLAKIGLAIFVSLTIFPWLLQSGYTVADNGLGYVALLMGEGLIGFAIGMLLQVVYAAFQTAGQFFSLQMGFGASEVFDPLSEEEIPLLGQFFNLIAMFAFLMVSGFYKVFLMGVFGSFKAMNATDLVKAHDTFFSYFVGALGQLFREALVISLPIVGTLFVVSIAMGLISKASPQLNLMNTGFPISILAAFALLIIALPFMLNLFNGIIDNSFQQMADLFLKTGGQVSLEAVPK